MRFSLLLRLFGPNGPATIAEYREAIFRADFVHALGDSSLIARICAAIDAHQDVPAHPAPYAIAGDTGAMVRDSDQTWLFDLRLPAAPDQAPTSAPGSDGGAEHARAAAAGENPLGFGWLANWLIEHQAPMRLGRDADRLGGGSDTPAHHGAGDSAGVGAAVQNGALSSTSFETDLGAALAGLGPGRAMVYTPDSGELAGQAFLVVDRNGVPGFQPGEDYILALPATTLADLAGHTDFIV